MEIYKSAGKVKVGPFTVSQIRSMISLQTMGPADLIWHEGLLGPIKLSESEQFSDDLMMAEMEASGRAAGGGLVAALEQVTQEAQQQAVRGGWAKLCKFAWNVGMVFGSYLMSEWLRGRLQADQVAGWYRGLVDGGYPALVHFVQGLLGLPKPVFWSGPISWGYTIGFWFGVVLTLISVGSFLAGLFKDKK